MLLSVIIYFLKYGLIIRMELTASLEITQKKQRDVLKSLIHSGKPKEASSLVQDEGGCLGAQFSI